MTRVVRCPHCLCVVRAQVDERCRCPSCGQYFIVSNPGRSILGSRRSLSSIPRGNQRSREGVGWARSGVGYGPILQGLAYSSQALERRNPTIPGLASTGTGESRREFEQGTIGEPSLYPKDPEWEIIDGNRDYQLIIDFPYHRDREIAVETEDGVLAIRSLKEDAPSRYHVEFALPPEVVEESLRWIFNNGALILHFDKKG